MSKDVLKIKEAIIVEGRYDQDKLAQIVDTIIIKTNGFSIFKDEEKKKYIKKLADERGIIILTDSDSAGFLIRNHLKSFISSDKITNIYIPQVEGVEKRKRTASKEGFLGVEGIKDNLILELLEKHSTKSSVEISYQTSDLYSLGLTGKPDSKIKKQEFLKLLNLPSYISNKELLKYMNMNKEKVEEIINSTPFLLE